MNALRDNQLIPYRESRLTNYLANFLTKESKMDSYSSDYTADVSRKSE